MCLKCYQYQYDIINKTINELGGKFSLTNDPKKDFGKKFFKSKDYMQKQEFFYYKCQNHNLETS